MLHTTTRYTLVSLALALAATGLLVAHSAEAPVTNGRIRSTRVEAALGEAAVLRGAYEEWLPVHEREGGNRNLVLRLAWSKGLSTEFSRAKGVARLDLNRGLVTVEVGGFGGEQLSDVWLVDNRPGPHDTVAPERGDKFLFVGRFAPSGGAARLTAHLGEGAFRDFDIDLVVVTRAKRHPADGGVLFGFPSLFQRVHRQMEQARLGLSPVAGASGSNGGSLGPLMDPLVDAGRNLFFNETFNGNGRTCGTCHPAGNNLTIDPTFIATLPADDPLFVAEFVPALGNDFENPALMRKAGLILENVDGFDDLVNKFVMRGVPHVLSLRTSILRAPGEPPLDGTSSSVVERTGWGGDGAAGSGTLREFATGAVRQHFTKTLDRVSGVDFRLPTDLELDAIVAFQLSLGRQADILDLPAVNFRSAVVNRGKVLFFDAEVGKCNLCHEDAGAAITVPGFSGRFNFNFDTGVDLLPDTPGDLIDPSRNPADGGFGTAPQAPRPSRPGIPFGDGSFSTPPLIEAADTGPFFHNNAIETVEEAVNFYNSDAFNASPSGIFLGGIRLQATQVVAIAAFLRVLNTLENIRQSIAAEEQAIAAGSLAAARPHIEASIEELQDAIEVLRCGRLHPEAITQLAEALVKARLARVTPINAVRNALVRQAIADKNAARADIVQ